MIIDKILLAGIPAGAGYAYLQKRLNDDVLRKDRTDEEMFEHIEDLSIRNRRKADRIITEKWFEESRKEIITLRSYDGLNLNGALIENHETDNYIIVVHGRHGNIKRCYEIAYNFDKLGYNSLVFDQRACGKSEGKYITYGFKESLDLIKWIAYLVKKRPKANICLHGTSLGAATVCMALGTKLPENVKCAIEDCGYHTMRAAYEHVNAGKNKLLVKAVLDAYDLFMKAELGFGFDDVRPVDCLRNNEIPICFVHGTEDKTVPYDSALILYNANKGPKKFYKHKCGHGEANLNPKYYIILDEFIRGNMK